MLPEITPKECPACGLLCCREGFCCYGIGCPPLDDRPLDQVATEDHDLHA